MKKLYKLFLIISLAIMSSSAYAQHDTDLYTFEETVNLKSVDLVVLGKVVEFKEDTGYSIKHPSIDDSETYVHNPESIIFEIESLFKGKEKRKYIKVVLGDCNINKRLSKHSFNVGGRYYLCLRNTGYDADSFNHCEESKGNYCIYNSGVRYLKIKNDAVLDPSGKLICFRGRHVNTLDFNKKISDQILHKTMHRIFDSYTIEPNFIWLKSDPQSYFDTSGYYLNGFYKSFSEVYAKTAILSNTFNQIGGGFIKFIPYLKYSTYINGCSMRMGVEPELNSDIGLVTGLGCFRFRIKNATYDSFSFMNLYKEKISKNDTNYIFVKASAMCYLDMKTIAFGNVVGDTAFCSVNFYFMFKEKITIEYDFAVHEYKIIFDGYVSKKEQDAYDKKVREESLRFEEDRYQNWKMGKNIGRQRELRNPYKYPSKLIEE